MRPDDAVSAGRGERGADDTDDQGMRRTGRDAQQPGQQVPDDAADQSRNHSRSRRFCSMNSGLLTSPGCLTASCLTSVGGRRSDGSAGTIDTGSHSDRATGPTKSRALISLRLGYRNIHPYSIFGEDSYARRTIFRLQ
jgi:hypothetical protein